MKILIAGAGIAGPTLAYWLLRAGHEPTLVERAPWLRRGGYVVDFWGAGFEVAEKMGIVPELMRAGHRIGEVRQVDRNGRRIISFDPEIFVRGAGGRYVSIARGDLAATLHESLGGRVETIFGDSVSKLVDGGEGVHVTFESGATRDFDLVVGADGLHSQIRRLVFGPQEQFEKDLGIKVAAFEVAGYRPRDELAAVMYTEVGYQITRLATRDDTTIFLVTVADGGGSRPQGVKAQQQFLRDRLAGGVWETPAILESMSAARSFYFDRVSQIRMPSWTRDRVVLLGDAAACVSLLAGQGSALAMVEAYVLASELGRCAGNYVAAFQEYEQRLAPFLASKQRAAVGFAGLFAPRTKFQLFLRNTAMMLATLPGVARFAAGRGFRDAIELP